MPQQTACCAHDHDCEAADCGPAWSLHTHIDSARVRALNATDSGQTPDIFRAWSRRLEPPSHPLSSNEDDPELIVHVPFTGSMKIKAFSVIGGTDGSAPASVRIFVNRDDLDFSAAADLQPVQSFSLQENHRGDMEYPTQVARFNGVHSLDLHFPDNFGAEATQINFIGFKGEYTEAKREAVTAVYEARPQVQDHKVPGMSASTFHNIS